MKLYLLAVRLTNQPLYCQFIVSYKCFILQQVKKSLSLSHAGVS